MKYEVKAVKGFMGSDCPGYNATLYRDGVKVALVINEGSGGEELVEWVDRNAPRVEVQTTDHNGKPMTMRCTPEEAKLMEFLEGKKIDLGGKLGESELTLGLFVAGLVDDFETIKRLKRVCSKKTLFRVKGDNEDIGAGPGRGRPQLFVRIWWPDW